MRSPVISLYQPWASLVFLDRPLPPKGKIKAHETRSYRMPVTFKGRLYIHAAQRRVPEAKVLLSMFGARFGEEFVTQHLHSLPYGCIIGSVIPGEAIRTEDMDVDKMDIFDFVCGDYSPNRFAWPLTDATLLPEPIPTRGFQRLWYYDL